MSSRPRQRERTRRAPTRRQAVQLWQPLVGTQRKCVQQYDGATAARLEVPNGSIGKIRDLRLHVCDCNARFLALTNVVTTAGGPALPT